MKLIPTQTECYYTGQMLTCFILNACKIDDSK